MQISIDGKEIFVIQDHHKKALFYDIHADRFEQSIQTRLTYAVFYKYSQALDRMKKDWIPVIQNRYQGEYLHSNADLIELITSQPDYKDRKAIVQEFSHRFPDEE